MRQRIHMIIALCASSTSFLAACSDSGPEQQYIPDQYLFGGERAAELLVPQSYDHQTPTPLLVVLHGYSANGFLQTAYTGLGDLTELGYLVIAPDGTVDSAGNQFWNATEECCDFDNSGVDDVAYLTELVAEIQGVYNVDPDRVYFFGHSNGGFMSYRMACERAEMIAAIVSLAGATFSNPADCAPAEPVPVLQIHGDQDVTVPYQAGPSSVAAWATYNGCTGALQQDAARLELDGAVDGLDTRVESYGDCPAGVDVALWTIEGGGHVPILPADFDEIIAAWLTVHPRP
jgi:polyhydroxybutyrate depolymerase